MSDPKFPLAVTLRSKDGKVTRKGTINNRTDSCSFDSVPAGCYTVSGLFADGSKPEDLESRLSSVHTRCTYYLLDSGNLHQPPIPPPPPHSKPPIKAIAGFAVAATLASNLGGATPLVQEISNALLKPQPPKSIPAQRAANPQTYKKTFSDRVEAQIKACIKNNAREFSGIPTLAKLLKSASWEREAEDEFEQQLIYLYDDYLQLRTAINKCDPMLAQKILVAREQADESMTVFVTGPLVNVRVGPNSGSEIIKPLPYGTPVLLDQATTASLSEDQKLAIAQGAGWQPIILSSGEAGYIYSLYISDSL